MNKKFMKKIKSKQKDSLVYGITLGNKKMKAAFFNALDTCLISMFKIVDESSFHYGDKGTIMESAKKILREVNKRSLEYTEETRQDYINDTIKKSAKVMEVIEIYSELIARGYEVEEAVVEISEKISFDLDDKEIKEYDLDRHRKRNSI